MKKLLALVVGVSLSSSAFAATPPPSFQNHPIVPDKELLITDVAVVDSDLARYPGALSFGHLMEQLAAKDKTVIFVREWLRSWTKNVEVNGQTVAARPAFHEQVIAPWMAKDGHTGEIDEWEIDLANAPFRLLAIVNRIDSGPFVQLGRREVNFGTGSSSIPAYYGSGGLLANTGEARLVYAATDAAGEPLAGGFTVIFEYRLPIPRGREEDRVQATETKRRLPSGFGVFERDRSRELTAAERTLPSRLQAARYAADWHALGTYAQFDDEYLCALTALTRGFTDRTASAPPLAQLRTNEGAFAGVQEAREYGYNGTALQMRPVAATPALVYNSDDMRFGRAMARYIDRNQRAILSNTNTLPQRVPDPLRSNETLPFLAGSALMPKTGNREAAAYRWDAPRVRYSEALRTFSMNTCSGCHCGETKTEFYHIHPRRLGQASRLSSFLQADAELEIDSLGARKSKVQLNEMGQRMVLFEAVLNPHYTERKVYGLLRDRVRRSH